MGKISNIHEEIVPSLSKWFISILAWSHQDNWVDTIQALASLGELIKIQAGMKQTLRNIQLLNLANALVVVLLLTDAVWMRTHNLH